MRAFKRYFAQMAKCIQQSPQQLAKKLFKKKLIAEKTLEKVKSSTGLSSLQKAEILLRAVDMRNITDESGKSLKKFCRVLDKYLNLKEVLKQMLKKFGRLSNTCVSYTLPSLKIFKVKFGVKLELIISLFANSLNELHVGIYAGPMHVCPDLKLCLNVTAIVFACHIASIY